jgi:hypothetical protein
VIPVRSTVGPRRALYRIGRLPNPLAWPPRAVVGDSRFDDPLKRFSTLYAAEGRLACFVEVLAQFRPSLQTLAAEQSLADTREPRMRPHIPRDWYDTRGIARLRVKPWQRWLDLRAIETREALRGEFAALILALGLDDLDVSGVSTSKRMLTQAVAGWAHANEYQGIVYPSRLDSTLMCWALFEGAVIEPVPPIRPIARDDPDLRAVAKLFGLVV